MSIGKIFDFKIIFMKKLWYFASILLVLNSCGGSKKTVTKTESKQQTKTTQPTIKPDQGDQDLDFATLRYIARYEDVAKKEMKEYGVPASITLAQGILESQSGKSKLAIEGNNHFGIKCHDNWHGEKILHDDNKAQECFRKYNNPEESFKDHSQFLAGRKRYAFLFRLPITDYEAWARGLKKAGYATDPSYPDKLIYLIEKYHLNKLDKDVLTQMSVKVDETAENHQDKKKKFIYEVQEGETLFTISRKFNVPVKDIQRINNLNDFDIYKGQILVLTESNNTGQDTEQPETTVPITSEVTNDVSTSQTETTPTKPVLDNTINPQNTGGNDNDKNLMLHVVKEDETLFSISKTSHVDIETLRHLNHLSNDEISVGQIIKIPKQEQIKNITSKDKMAEPIQKQYDSKTKNTDNAVYHIVKPGETLYRIHINYKVPIRKLRKLNHLKGNYIKVGQKIRVK